MAEINGQLSSCDRCGAQVFRKTIGDGDADGGFTRWNKFEPYPPGWGTVSVPHELKNGTRSDIHIRVCPECNRLWRLVLNEGFLKDTKFYLKSV